MKRLIVDLATVVFRLLFGGEAKAVVAEHVEIRIGKFEQQQQQQPFRVAFLSDFHFNGVSSSSSSLRRCVSSEVLDDALAKVAAFNPDVVLLGGDFVDADGRHAAELCNRWLARLSAPCGVFAVLGNHCQKRIGNREQVVSALSAAGVRLLDNERAVLRRNDASEVAVELVGIGDLLSAGDFAPQRAFEGIIDDGDDAGTAVRIALTHNPDAAVPLGAYPRCDLQLSGHTHGGQIVVPRVGPLIPWLARRMPAWVGKHLLHAGSVRNWQWAQGLHTVGEQRLLYVTRGLASHPPGRLNCAPEVTLISVQL